MKEFLYNSLQYEPVCFYASSLANYSLFAPQEPVYLVNYSIQYAHNFPLQNIVLNHSYPTGDLSNYLSFQPETSLLTPNSVTSAPSIQNGELLVQIADKIQNKLKCVINKKHMKIDQQQDKIVSKSSTDRFIKKNTQSNVVNQIFSFLWSPEKSRIFLTKILGEVSKVEVFYQLMRIIKLTCKSQLNRVYLKELMDVNEWQCGFKKLKKKVKRIDQIGHELLVRSIRILVLLYLRDISRYSIMTSKKMSKKLWNLHFRKCDEILCFLFESDRV